MFVSCYTFDKWSGKGAAGMIIFAEVTIILKSFEWHKFSWGKFKMLMKNILYLNIDRKLM